MPLLEESEQDQRTLLIVDDEPEIRELLENLLKDIVPIIYQADNGDLALKVIKDNPVDAIITDVSMPVMTGLQLLSEINSSGLKIPVVVFSGFLNYSNTELAYNLGAKDFLEKPFNKKQLRDVIRHILNSGNIDKEIEQEIIDLCKVQTLGKKKESLLKKAKLEFTLLKDAIKAFKR